MHIFFHDCGDQDRASYSRGLETCVFSPLAGEDVAALVALLRDAGCVRHAAEIEHAESVRLWGAPAIGSDGHAMARGDISLFIDEQKLVFVARIATPLAELSERDANEIASSIWPGSHFARLWTMDAGFATNRAYMEDASRYLGLGRTGMTEIVGGPTGAVHPDWFDATSDSLPGLLRFLGFGHDEILAMGVAQKAS